jgi:hypothetical protein
MASRNMTAALESFLNEVGKHIPRKEKTLFSLGGRGYYENPASDVLAFFLRPDEEHGFKALFLETFLECMNVVGLEMSGVKVEREVETGNGRIDIVVDGPDWLLLIENKIRHDQVNDFADYEAYGRRRLAGSKEPLMAILSPEGKKVIEKWEPVSYQNYCAALRRRLVQVLFDHACTKWAVFAREFILHFENELNQPSMNDNAVEFVEEHTEQIEQATKLASDYRAFLLELLKNRLGDALKNHSFTINNDLEWGLRCYADRWGGSFLAFLPRSSNPDRKFHVRVYLINFTPAQEEQARREFQKERRMKPGSEGSNCLSWQTQSGFDKRTLAVDELCDLGMVLAGLFKTPTDPVLPSPPSQTIH